MGVVKDDICYARQEGLPVIIHSLTHLWPRATLDSDEIL